jgi:CheY-like chemotaxis protein
MLPMNLKVLLADDKEVNQKILQKMLKKLGYHADIASNGLEAITSFESKYHDVILIDIQMPEMDGLEATRVIRERWPDRNPKIVAVTAYSNCFDKELCFSAGVDEYLTKPLRLEELQSTMSKVTNNSMPED